MPRLKSACSIASPLLPLCLTLAAASTAHAAYTVILTESAGNVVATGSGSIDTTTLGSPLSVGGEVPRIEPEAAAVQIGGDVADSFALYRGPFAGPDNIGSGGAVIGDAATGVFVAFDGESPGALAVPHGYVSGTPLGTSTATFLNATFDSLGLTPGSYQWTVGSGAGADTFTIDVAVPEPASASLLTLGSVGLLARRHRQHQPHAKRL